MKAHACSPSYMEAEVGGLLEPQRLRLQRAMIAPLHFSLGNGVRPCPHHPKKIIPILLKLSKTLNSMKQ